MARIHSCCAQQSCRDNALLAAVAAGTRRAQHRPLQGGCAHAELRAGEPARFVPLITAESTRHPNGVYVPVRTCSMRSAFSTIGSNEKRQVVPRAHGGRTCSMEVGLHTSTSMLECYCRQCNSSATISKKEALFSVTQRGKFQVGCCSAPPLTGALSREKGPSALRPALPPGSFLSLPPTQPLIPPVGTISTKSPYFTGLAEVTAGDLQVLLKPLGGLSECCTTCPVHVCLCAKFTINLASRPPGVLAYCRARPGHA